MCFLEGGIPLQLRGELFRYILAGAGTMIACLVSMWILVAYLGFNRIISLNVTAVFGYFFSYSFTKMFVFKKNERSHLFYGSRFILLQGVLLILNNALFYAGINWFGWHYLLVNCVIAFMMSVLNFILLKLSVFRGGPALSES
jgi:putative flippase GtrA